MNPELDALALDAWPDVVQAIDTLVRRAEVGGWGTVRPGTSLATDDARTSPFQTSHAIQLLLNAATDNLHGVRHMIWGPLGHQTDQPVIHQAAHYLLARGAMENAAAALWILAPPSRAERVTRTLRWHAQNAKDESQALAEIAGSGVADVQQRQVRFAEIYSAATGNGQPSFRPGYTVTETMRYVTELEQRRSRLPAIFVWRLCSGFAHGRPWASLGFQDVETEATDDPEVFSARLTSDLTRALLAPKHALHLVEHVLRLYELRNTPT